MESHLLQMRGLKPKPPINRKSVIVASFTDAWIETSLNLPAFCLDMSHLLQMRGLKQSEHIKEYDMGSRIFYRCVD